MGKLAAFAVCVAAALGAPVAAQDDPGGSAPAAPMPHAEVPPNALQTVAPDPGAADYERAIDEAVAHYAAQRWPEALQAFRRAHLLKPSARTLRGVGLAAFYAGEHAAARRALEAALGRFDAPLADAQRTEIESLLETLRGKTARFELALDPAGARVEVDGAATDEPVLFLNRGEHVVSASADGHATTLRPLTVIGGEDRTLVLSLAPVPTATAPSTPADAPSAEPAPKSVAARPAVAAPGRKRLFTWIALGAAPVFAATAGIVWSVGVSEHERVETECAEDGCDQAEAERRAQAANLDAYGTWTTVSLVASGAALLTAGVLFFVEDRSRSETRLSVGPGRVTWSGSF